MKKISVFTHDRLLFRRLFLLLCEEYDVSLCNETEGAVASDIKIVDLDFFPDESGELLLSRSAARDAIAVPFSFSEIENALEGISKSDTGRLILLENERAARLDGTTVRLTDVEYRLLSVLLSVPVGEYVPKQRLVTEVWGEGASEGVVNVYIHYLREKLEKNGEKIIISSRNLGYKINERTVSVC